MTPTDSNSRFQISKFYRVVGSVLFLIRHVFPKNYFLKKIWSNYGNQVSRTISAGETIEIDRRVSLSSKEFCKNYLYKGIPVIFDQECIIWESTRKWNLHFFKEKFSDLEMNLVEPAGLSENTGDQDSLKTVSGRDFLNSLIGEQKMYLRFSSLVEDYQDLQNDLNQPWLKKMRRGLFGVSYQTFIGPKGGRTPIHSDTTAFFYIMSEGEKKWTLYDPEALVIINPEVAGRGYSFSNVDIKNPDLLRYPGFNKLTKYTCHLRKGDILFVPSWMWHEVENVTDSWGVSYRFTSLRSFLQQPTYWIRRVFFTNPTFIEILFYSFFKKDLSKRTKNLLTPRIFIGKKS